MAKSKTGDGVILVAFKNKESASEILKKWPIAQDESGTYFSIQDVLNERKRWSGVPVTFYENSLNLILEVPCSVERFQKYISDCRLRLDDNSSIVGCIWVGKSEDFTVFYDLGSNLKSFQAKIDSFMPLKEAKEEFFTLREILYRATMDRLFVEEIDKLSESEKAWFPLFAPID